MALRARWVTLRARGVTLRARWVTLRARWVTLRARWVTLRARWVTFRLAYELGLRSITPLSLVASKAVEKFRGPSLKSALRHTFVMDRRDDARDPTLGYVVRSTAEVAGLGPLSANLLRYALSLSLSLSQRWGMW
jgi:outer membrane protein assembly factor BamA